MRPDTMTAAFHAVYGPPDVLEIRSLPRPAVRDGGVLVEVVAAALNKGDWHLLTGTPLLIRAAGFGLTRPNQPIPGLAIAGRVAAVGGGVTEFSPGDEVFGEVKGGGFAGYVCAEAGALAPVPPGLSLEDAASLPVAATSALQGLRDAGRLQPGQSVLINGAAGGVGSFAVQIAKAMGAEVTGVCSAGSAGTVRGIGADHVIDYGTTDFTATGARYDVILDMVGNRPLSACRAALKPGGRYVACAGGAEHPWVGPMLDVLWGVSSNLFSSTTFVGLVATPTREALSTVAAMAADGRVRPVIERRIPLSGLAAAMAELGRGHSRGRTIIQM